MLLPSYIENLIKEQIRLLNGTDFKCIIFQHIFYYFIYLYILMYKQVAA